MRICPCKSFNIDVPLFLRKLFKIIFTIQGHHELRKKPDVVPPSQLPPEVKKKLAEKAKSLPGFKTRLCSNFENDGTW